MSSAYFGLSDEKDRHVRVHVDNAGALLEEPCGCRLTDLPGCEPCTSCVKLNELASVHEVMRDMSNRLDEALVEQYVSM
jgi:hypothetical protein